MKLYNDTFKDIITRLKLGKQAQQQLLNIIESSTDYWTTTPEAKELLHKSAATTAKKLYYAFMNYCEESNQYDLTSKKLTESEIKAMDNWVNDEYKKAEARLNKTKASKTIIESITSDNWNNII